MYLNNQKKFWSFLFHMILLSLGHFFTMDANYLANHGGTYVKVITMNLFLNVMKF